MFCHWYEVLPPSVHILYLEESTNFKFGYIFTENSINTCLPKYIYYENIWRDLSTDDYLVSYILVRFLYIQSNLGLINFLKFKMCTLILGLSEYLALVCI